MGRFKRSKAMMSASWGILRADKELMVLQLVSGVVSFLVALTFLVPIALTSLGEDAFGDVTVEMNVVSYALIFAMYLVSAYVVIFFRVAVLCGADQRMSGQDPTFGSSIAGARRHAGKLLPWAVVSATVSVALRAVADRVGFIGQILVGLVGAAWAVVTFLVLPVLVFQDVGVGQAIKQSATMLKKTWGENLIVNFGIGLVNFLLVLPAVLLVVGALVSGVVALIVAAAVLAVIWFVAVACWANAMTAVFQLVLYRYATQADLPPAFAQLDLANAFGHKKAGVR